MLSQKFYGSEMRHGIFGGLNFGAGIFLGFEFCPHSIIPVTWNQEYPPPRGGLEGLENVIVELHPHTKRACGQSPIAKECGNLSIPENLVITWGSLDFWWQGWSKSFSGKKNFGKYFFGGSLI